MTATPPKGGGEGDGLSQVRVFTVLCSSSCTCTRFESECYPSGVVALLYLEDEYLKTCGEKLCLLI